jgi:hypothetical protein
MKNETVVQSTLRYRDPQIRPCDIHGGPLLLCLILFQQKKKLFNFLRIESKVTYLFQLTIVCVGGSELIKNCTNYFLV